MKKSFLVIGLGRFGSSVVKELYKNDCEVAVCDIDEDHITDLDEYFHHHVLGDAKEDTILDDLDVNSFNTIIVSIGDAFESSVLITKKLKDRGCKYVIAKAKDRQRGEILEAVGADEVVYPEEEAGSRIARKISFRGIIEYMELNDRVGGIEIEVPSPFYGRSLSELNFTAKYELTVVLILRDNKPILHHFAYEKLQEKDCFLIVGENKRLNKFIEKFCNV